MSAASRGYDFDSQRENRGEEKDGFLAILEPKPETLPFLAMNIILPQWVASRVPSKANRDFNDGISCLRRLCDQAASEKRRVIRSKQENAEFDLLGQIVERGIFPEAELGDQLATLFIAGTHSFMGLEHALEGTWLESSYVAHLR
ncbi:hypothetical protein APSETT444_000577 [Aspergillus pseudonomiae]